MNDGLKQAAAEAALKYIPTGAVVGVGTGSTTNFFIAGLAKQRDHIHGAVASSEITATLLKQHKIPVLDFPTVNELTVYVDGADAFNKFKQLSKGAAGALTREKILAYASKSFICIVDDTKQCDILGKVAIPVEVIPMARSYVAREIVKLGGQPEYREQFVTDNGNFILDVHNWQIEKPLELEAKLNQIPGVVCNGIFASRVPDKIIIGHKSGVSEL